MTPRSQPTDAPPEVPGHARPLPDSDERLTRLHSVTGQLSAAQTMADVAGVAVAAAKDAVGADCAMIATLTPDRRILEVLRATGYNAETVERFPRFDVGASLPAAEAVRLGAPVIITSEARRQARYPGLPPMEDDQLHAALPLVARGRPVGAVGFSWRHRAAFSDDDRSFLETVAQQLSQALDRARLYDASVETARLLQGTLLPSTLPEVRGLQIAARYQPVDDGAVVGGDFYDVFRRPDGQTFGLSIGDVSGKGVHAASLTALARHTIRAASRRTSSPAAVLQELNDAILADDNADRYLTVAHLVLQPGQMATDITVSLGGHPQPFLRSADGGVRPVGQPGSAVGLLDKRGQWRDAHVTLAAGNVLVLYTDGLTDVRRSGHGELAGDLLADVLARSDARDAETLADEIMDAVLDFAGGARRDDMALLVLYPKLGGPADAHPAA